MIPYPNINPTIVCLGPFSIKWYGLAYVVSFAIGYIYIYILAKKNKIPLLIKDVDTLFLYSIIGVVGGGRIGYILIYNFNYYISHPLHMLFIWEGGMSFHGGLIGFIIMGLIFCSYKKINAYNIADRIVLIIPIGLFLGRIANFINGELCGRATNLPWGMVFPQAGPTLRHPSQLYEAFFEGIVIFLILDLSRNKLLNIKGALFWLFIILYGFFRFMIEFTRKPDPQMGFVVAFFTVGQILSALMFVIGVVAIISVWRKNVRRNHQL
ncbi:MAG: prolipoprotein diacylglyceryl transferase [Campylobacterota bacterium]|nr:prolipoprotein diacylglyceryl transferase [Campylobacterota bacterium]